jgi:protocatechuate 3,4-dioxygenase beta subunit
MQHDSCDHRPVSRRDLLRVAGVAGAGTLLAGHATAAHPPMSPALRAAAAAAGPASAVLTRMCTLTPQQTEGPFYLNQRLLRRDITEGKPGLPLLLFFLVVRASDCSPVSGAIVDVWHDDALGSYSGFPSQGTAGQTFLRGVQTTDGIGLVWFQSVYPGWYPGRTAHTHFKVHLGNQTAVTSQSYFPDGVTDLVYRLMPPYNTRGARNTRNTNDGIFDARNVKTVQLAPDGSLALWAGMIIGIA